MHTSSHNHSLTMFSAHYGWLQTFRHKSVRESTEALVTAVLEALSESQNLASDLKKLKEGCNE